MGLDVSLPASEELDALDASLTRAFLLGRSRVVCTRFLVEPEEEVSARGADSIASDLRLGAIAETRFSGWYGVDLGEDGGSEGRRKKGDTLYRSPLSSSN